MTLPNRVFLTEVGLRDGLQSLPFFLPTEKKIEIVNHLQSVGIKDIELTSFVSPEIIPQLADAKSLSAAVISDPKYDNVRFSSLIPNLKGAELASAAGYSEIRFVISVSERHNLSNTNQTVQASLNQLSQIRKLLPDIRISVILATVFGCPYRGDIPITKVLKLAKSVKALGVYKIGLADTTGKAQPAIVKKVLQEYLEVFEGFPPFLHMHNFDGTAYDSIAEALKLGITEFDSAFGGLGGCPAVPNAPGNVSTEELIKLFNRLDISCGIDYASAKPTFDLIRSIL